MSGFDRARLRRLGDLMAGHVEEGGTGGVAWLAARDSDIAAGAAGVLTRGEPAEVGRDSIFRIASMTKPIVAVAALILVEECRLRIDEPVDDLLPELAVRRVLLDGRGPMEGRPSRLLSRASVQTMTTDRIGAGPGVPGPSPGGGQGWGFGVGVQLRRTGVTSPAGSYGWAGGLGSSWANDPGERLVGVVLTTDMFTGAFPPPAVIRDFWTGVYAALGD